VLEDIAKAGAVLTVANATSASAIKAENVFMVYLLVGVCSLSVMDQLNSGYRRRYPPH